MWVNWKRFSLGAVVLASLSLLLFGCGDFGGTQTAQNTSTKLISGVVSDPATGLPAADATVTAYGVDASGVQSTAPLSIYPVSTTTNYKGSYKLKIPESYTGAVIIEAEIPASGVLPKLAKLLYLATPQKIRAVVPQAQIAQAVIPPAMVSLATNTVVEFIRQNSATTGFVPATIQQANLVMETFFGPNFAQIPPPASATDTNTTKEQQDLMVSIAAVNAVVTNNTVTIANIVTAVVAETGLGTLADQIKNEISTQTTLLTAAGTLPPEYVPSAQINTAISNAQTVAVAAPTFTDTTAPTAPASLTGSAANAKSVNLAWLAATDSGTGVAGYTVCRADASGIFLPIATVGAAALSFSDVAVAPGSTYSYKVYAFDAVRNSSEASNTVSATTALAADTIAPSQPGGLNCKGFTTSQVNLQWQQATKTNPDGSVTPAAKYNVYRNSQLIATVADTSYIDTTVAAGTIYTYFVKASDTIGNLSPASVVVTVRTAVPVSPSRPTAPSALVAGTVGYNKVPLTWTASATAGVSYNVYRGSMLIATGIKVTSYSDASVLPNSSYSYTVTAFDANGESDPSNALSATTLADPSATDTVAPSVPVNLVALGATATSVALDWSASTKTTGDKIVAGYDVYRATGSGGLVKIATVRVPGYVDTSVSASTSYIYQLKSFSTAGVRSEGSLPWSVTTPAAVDLSDTTPPTAPANLALTAPAAASGVVFNWTASADPGGAVAGYLVFRNGSQIADIKPMPNESNVLVLATSYADTTVQPLTSYTYTVKAYDNPGNVSTASNELAVTTPAAPPNTYTIYGRVAMNGIGVAGIILSNGTESVVTDSNGNFSFAGLSNGSYTVTPIYTGYYRLAPESKTLVVNGANLLGQNFSATLSGTLSGGVSFPDGSITGGLNYPYGSVVGGISFPNGTVIGGISYPAGTVIGGISYPGGSVIGGVVYPTGTVIGGVTYPNGVVIGGVAYPAGTVVGGIAFPNGLVFGRVTYPDGTITGTLAWP